MSGVEHDLNLPFDAQAALDRVWSDRVYEGLLSGALTVDLQSSDGVETVLFSGGCPRCGGHMEFRQVLGAAALAAGKPSSANASGGAAGGQSVAAGERVAFVAWCLCGHAHEGCPTAGPTGCGAAFTVELSS